MIDFAIAGRGVDASEIDRIRDGLGRAAAGHRGRIDVTVFDGHQEEDLPAALAAPAGLVVDARCSETGVTVRPSAVLTLVVSTLAANRLDIADGFAAALEHRRAELAGRVPDIRYALQEAIGNAVIHGNLGLDGTLRGSLESLRVFAETMEQRLADTHRSRLPIVISAETAPDGVVIMVEDRGGGFAPERVRPTDNPAAGGMGLSIIRMYARSVAFDLDGRRIAMNFGR